MNRIGELSLPISNISLPGLPLIYDGERLTSIGGLDVLLRHWHNPSSRMSIIASIDPTHHGNLLHVSIAGISKIPSWSEIKAVRDYFYPSDVDVMMVLPRKEDYVNIYKFAMHLWQMPMEWRIQ